MTVPSHDTQGKRSAEVMARTAPGGYGQRVSPLRRCSRTACGRSAVATLTYVYSDSTAVVGPLATYAEPHSYDLCDAHADRLTAPRGWEVVRLDVDSDVAIPGIDDIAALADAVREAARPAEPAVAVAGAGDGGSEVRRGHLRAVQPSN
jgi:anti-sigma factor ChrR (cupin superfamily)